MTPAALIKQAREKKGWTQKQLAEAIGTTASFVTKVETEEAIPGYERCLALASVLALSVDDLWAQVEQARTAMFKHRLRTRGAAVRGESQMPSALGAPSATPPAPEMSAADIAREVAANADLQGAYHDLKTALADPQLREPVLQALRAFALAAKKGT